MITLGRSSLFAGAPEAALKTIGTVTENFTAGEEKIVGIDWDLTDLTDTNGGVWPSPISAFTHFCMKVEVAHPADVNLCNNNAQNNFTRIRTTSGSDDLELRR